LQADLNGWQRQAELARTEAIRPALASNPTAPVRSQDSTLANFYGYFQPSSFFPNPVQLIERAFSQLRARQLTVQASVRFQWAKGLATEINFSQARQASDWGTYQNTNSGSISFPGPHEIALQQPRYTQNQWQALISYAYDGPRSHWRLLAGGQRLGLDAKLASLSISFLDSLPTPTDLRGLLDQREAYAQFIPSPPMPPGYVTSLASEQVEVASHLNSVFARVQWRYRKLLAISTTLRRDWTSILGQEQATWSPAASAALRLDQWAGSPMAALDLCRLRVSAGQSSQLRMASSAPFLSPAQWTTGPPTVSFSNFPNSPDGVNPELLRSVDFGLDLAGKHWSVSVTAYQRDTRNPWVPEILVAGGTSFVMTERSVIIEDLRIRNRGLEAQLGAHLQKGAFRYQAHLI